MDFFRDIMKTKTDKNNFLICLLIWVSTSLTYNDILLELENVGQSLYINMSLIALIEVFASYIAGFIVLKFNIMNSIKKMLSISFVLYLGFYFAPNSSKNIGIFIVFLACKLLSETIYNLANIYTPKIVSDKYTVYFFIFTRLCSRILLLFLPHINHLFCFLKIHPFVFLSSIYGISRYLSDYVKEPIVHAVKSHSTQLKVEKELAELNFVTAN